MGKSKLEKQLEKMTQERDHWRNLAKQLKAENDEAKATAETAAIIAKSIGGELSEQINQLVKHRNWLQEQYTALRNRYVNILGVEVGANLTQEQTKQLVESEETQQMIEDGLVHVLRTRNPMINVGYVIVAFHPESGLQYHTGRGNFCGTPGDFENIVVNYIHSYVWNAPSVDDLRGAELDHYGKVDDNNQTLLTREVQHKAVASLSLYWHDELMREQWDNAVDDMFTAFIEPLLKMPSLRDEARKRFGILVRKTYEHIGQKRENFRDDRPKSKRGRRSKKN